MDYEHFTFKLQDALQNASVLAQKNDHSEIGLEHLLLALLAQEDGIVPPVIERIGVNAASLSKQLEERLNDYPKVTGNTQMRLSDEVQKILAKAETHMAKLKDQYLSTEHILLAMTESDGKTGQLLQANGITGKAVLEALKSVRGNVQIDSQDPYGCRPPR